MRFNTYQSLEISQMIKEYKDIMTEYGDLERECDNEFESETELELKPEV